MTDKLKRLIKWIKPGQSGRLDEPDRRNQQIDTEKAAVKSRSSVSHAVYRRTGTAGKRAISVFMSAVLMVNSVLFDVPGGFFDFLHIDNVMAAEAAYTPTTDQNAFSTTIQVDENDTSKKIFYDYCYYYQNIDSFAEAHQNDRIDINSVHEFDSDFVGIGNANYPFKGSVYVSATDIYTLSLPSSLFTHVFDSVSVKGYGNENNIELQLTRTGTDNTALMAQHVYHDDRIDNAESGKTKATWKVQLVSGNTNSYGGVIGEMGESAKLTLIYTDNSGAGVQADGNVGALCGTMETESELYVSYNKGNSNTLTITSESGNAGGLVGEMRGTARLHFITAPVVASAADTAGSSSEESNHGLSVATVKKMVVSNLSANAPTIGTVSENAAGKVVESDDITENSEIAENEANEALDETSAGEGGEQEDVDGGNSNNANGVGIAGGVENILGTSYSLSSVPLLTATPEEDGSDVDVTLPSFYVTAKGTNGNAGGIVGKMPSTAVIDGFNTLTVRGTVTGGNGSGGLYGNYVNLKETGTSTVDGNAVTTVPEFDIAKYDIGGTSAELTVDGLYAGGLIGVLENGSEAGRKEGLKFTNSGGSGVVNTAYAVGSAYITNNSGVGGYYGGLIGRYVSTDLSDTLELDSITATSNSQSAINAYGGVIGLVDTVSYVKANDVNVTAKHSNVRENNNPNYAFFGGVIGATNKSYNGTTNNSNAVFIDLGGFTLTFNKKDDTVDDQSGYKGGGVVGQFYKGVLRLSGTTDFSDARAYGWNSGDTGSNYGQIVGYNDDTLIYALGDGNANESATYNSGWQFKRFSGESMMADDLGKWGEVARIADIETNILTPNIESHKVELKSPVAAMGTQDDFVKTALNIQLNDGTYYNGVLTFEDSTNTSDKLLASSNLSLSNNISLSGTGVTGFMRDGSATGTFDASNVGDVGVFSGTFDGNDYSITLATGEIYGENRTSLESSGQIYRHRLNGLFSVIGGGTVQNLTVAGTQTIHNDGGDGMSIGGIAARTHGGLTTITKVKVEQSVNYSELNTDKANSEGFGKNIGGVIGYVDKTDDTTINITGTNTLDTTFNFSGYHKTWLVHGALIGKIASADFDLNIAQNSGDKVTVSHETKDEGVNSDKGGNAYGGGIVGYIIANGEYSDRVVNINNLEYDGSIDLNIAKTNGGGLLGYSWQNADVTIDGLTVESAELSSPSVGNVGALCYSASGRWTVNSVDLTDLTIKSGAGTSLGMLVNKAYEGDNGLYLNLLNSGYKLVDSNNSTKKVNLDNITVNKFDEIAAYTASTVDNVLKGGKGVGVISVNMSSAIGGDGKRTSGSALITSTGTYQNQLSDVGNTKYPNSTARYYYNLDNMSTDDVAQAAVLWSVYQYAPTNIKGLFNSTLPFTFEGSTDIDLSGYSFYPIYSIGDINLSNVNITFDYKGIYDTAEGVRNSDSYNRDPGDNGSGINARNQHFLMQSGLFINVDETKTVTLNTVKFSGNFLEVGDYKGVLVSGTCKGSIEIDGLVLDGITPKTTAGEAYTDGYLLVNKVVRDNANSGTVSLNINHVSNTNAYPVKDDSNNTSTAKITKSLFGTVNGPDITVTLTAIKLDARKSSLAVTDQTAKAALDRAYGTLNSIFTTATLFDSIKTTSLAQLTYTYEYKEDWGVPTGESDPARYVTYGYEVSGSVEHANEEKNYNQDTAHYTNPVDSDITASSPYTFDAEKWLPYVTPFTDMATAFDTSKTADSNGCYSRELAVNVTVINTLTGCGTYNDPYVITDGGDLEKIASFLRTGTAKNVLESIGLPKTQYEGVAANTKGDRWCNDDHLEYTLSADGTIYTAKTATGKVEWSVDNVRLYLAGAYYKINGNITLSEDFVGLGGGYTRGTTTADTTGQFAFRGVIVGATDEDGSPKWTITNESQNPLIKISNGSVVKDIKVVQAADVTLNQTVNASDKESFGYNPAAGGNTGCTYYGGIIGEIMGGDNIIDNSYVDFEHLDEDEKKYSKITLTGNNGTIVPVGGYVGVIVFGGLIFKNMTADETTIARTHLNVVYTGKNYNLANNSDQEAWAAIYVNPLVGRVINGYAVNETTQFSVTEDGHYHDSGKTERTGKEHTLKNGTKHYSIADINKNESAKLEVSKVPTSTTDDGIINIPNSQAFFILSLITQSTSGTAQTADGSYIISDALTSLSYGRNSSSVYGTSHLASYTNVGVGEKAQVSDCEDFYKYAKHDTAAGTAVPYIIEHYTKKEEDTSETSTEEVVVCESDAAEEYTGDGSDLNNRNFYIYRENAQYLTFYDSQLPNAKGDNDKSKAQVWTFESDGLNSYYIYVKYNDGKLYLKFSPLEGGLKCTASLVSDKSEASVFSVAANQGCYGISTSIEGSNFYLNAGSDYIGWHKSPADDNGSRMHLLEHIIETESITTVSVAKGSCPARCVTSTLGYYDINLTKGVAYVLPDSFRGLGAVGYYDDLQAGTNTNSATGNGYADRYKNRYCMKVDKFNGNGASINQDIYLNKYFYDNYFNVIHKNSNATQNVSSNIANYNINNQDSMHGIGLFDTIVMRDSSSELLDFTLTGSVNTDVYNNTYTTIANDQEKTGVGNGTHTNGEIGWLVSGGVVGHSLKGTWVNFTKISLNDLKVRGNSCVGGLLGFSKNSSVNIFIVITQCSANNISIDMPAGANEGNGGNPRPAAGAFVGKVYEGGVKIYGTDKEDGNTDTTKFSTVTISDYEIYTGDPTVCVGGLVGYAGNGCEAYDMHIEPKAGESITIGNSDVRMAGGIVGLVQPCNPNDNNHRARAVFKNCQIENINIQASRFAGGLYGGTTGAHNITSYAQYSTYQIKIQNCKMIGGYTGDNDEKVNNTIIGAIYAGGFVADGYVVASGTNADPNIIISDSVVSNYDMTSGEGGYVGGFIGYCGVYNSGSAVASVYNSSVEECTLGDTDDYTGGVVGLIQNSSANSDTKHRILGYNIKLDRIATNALNTRTGTWIGKGEKTNGSTITVQLSGIGIYGVGIPKNIGDGTLDSASFVYADYDNQNRAMVEGNKNKATYNDTADVNMPKYPYVNINPQSSMGTKTETEQDPLAEGENAAKVISGDGAVLLSTASSTSDYAGKTAEKTMALKLYEDLSNTTNTRRYTTFGDTYKDLEIANGNAIDYYFKRTIDDDGDRISTYATETGFEPSGWADFACVVIANTNNAETTALINRYIQLVTNTTDDYAVDNATYFKVDISQCKLINGYFMQTTADPGIAHENGQFKLVQANADSIKNTFTLLDVQFYDPLTVGSANKVAYHLYVPVYTIKQMTYDFHSSVLTGTDSVTYENGAVKTNEYANLFGVTNNVHLDTFNSWATTYIRYSYATEDLNALINAGNINWNHKKFITFTLGTDDYDKWLSDDTYMVLVDPNAGKDKAYYATFADFKGTEKTKTEGSVSKQYITLALEQFKRGSAFFEGATFNDMIADSLQVIENPGEGFYRKISDTPPVNDGKTYVYREEEGNKIYYEYVPTGTGDYDLSLPDDYVLNEDYYISAYAPERDDITGFYVYDYKIDGPETLEAPKVGTKSATRGVNDTYEVIIGELFTQSTDTLKVTPDDQQITANNREINVYTTTSIWLTNPQMGIKLGGSQQGVFHGLNINLDRYDEVGGITNEIVGLKDETIQRIQAWYSTTNALSYQDTGTPASKIDLKETYLYVQTADDIKDALKETSEGKPYTIYTRVKMNFDENKIEEEFPQKKGNNGVNVRVASNLAYDADKLGTAAMTKEYAKDDHMYYIDSVDSATLTYSEVVESDLYDSTGRDSENHSRLGVNGRTSELTLMPIDTYANYNTAALNVASEDANYLHLRFALNKKTDTIVDGNVAKVEYVPVKISDYMSGEITFKSGDIVRTVNVNSEKVSTEGGGTYIDVIIPKSEALSDNTGNSGTTTGQWAVDNDIYRVDISFNVKTGEGFKDYANYRIDLQAALMDTETHMLDATIASDHLVYTNAKVNHEFVKPE